VHREVAILRWGLVDGAEPHVAGGQRGDIAAEFVGGMVGQRVSRARGRLHPRRIQGLTIGQDGAVHTQRSPVELRGEAGLAVDGEQPVAQVGGDLEAFGAQRRDQEGTSMGRSGACPAASASARPATAQSHRRASRGTRGRSRPDTTSWPVRRPAAAGPGVADGNGSGLLERRLGAGRRERRGKDAGQRSGTPLGGATGASAPSKLLISRS
jgi:hypothetical protein